MWRRQRNAWKHLTQEATDVKTLIFGLIRIQVDLDEQGEKILIEAIKEEITFAERDWRWRTNNADFLSEQQRKSGDLKRK